MFCLQATQSLSLVFYPPPSSSPSVIGRAELPDMLPCFHANMQAKLSPHNSRRMFNASVSIATAGAVVSPLREDSSRWIGLFGTHVRA